MKFGDLVVNGWASNRNPGKILMVVRHGKQITCLATDGRKLIFENDSDLKLTKIGEIDFTEWKSKLKTINLTPEGE